MRQIFAFGDSVMKGVVSTLPTDGQQRCSYCVCPQNFVDDCSRRLGVPIVNLSRFGSTIIRGLEQLGRHLHRIAQGDVVVLEFGGNDCNFDWSAVSRDPLADHQPQTALPLFADAYARAIDLLRNVGARPLLLSLPALDSQLFFEFVSRGLEGERILRWLGGDVDHIGRWHEQYNLQIFKLGASRGVPVIDISTPFLRQPRLADFYCPDGMHPNAAGHRLICQALLDQIASLQTKD